METQKELNPTTPGSELDGVTTVPASPEQQNESSTVPADQDPDAIIPPSPGTGIDTDGDGTANEIVAPEEEVEPVHVDHPDDYKNMVKLSDSIGNTVKKSVAKALINKSGIHQHYKDIMQKEVKAGQFSPKYAEVFKKIRNADESGSIYRPGADGL